MPGPWPASGCRTLSRDGGRDWIGGRKRHDGAAGRWQVVSYGWTLEKTDRETYTQAEGGVETLPNPDRKLFQSILTPTLPKSDVLGKRTPPTKRIRPKPKSAVASARLPRQPRYERAGGRPHDITAGPVVSVVWAKKKGGEEGGQEGQAKRGTTRMRRPAERILFCPQGVTEDGGRGVSCPFPITPRQDQTNAKSTIRGKPKNRASCATPDVDTVSPQRARQQGWSSSAFHPFRSGCQAESSPGQATLHPNQKPSRRNRSESAESQPQSATETFS